MGLRRFLIKKYIQTKEPIKIKYAVFRTKDLSGKEKRAGRKISDEYGQ